MIEQPGQIAIAVVERHGAYLIGQRPLGVHLAGYWEFPGGKALAGERLEAATIRECGEETGLTISIERLLCEVFHEYPQGALRLCFFLCHCGESTTPRTPFRWVPRDELSRYRFPEANQRVLDLLAKLDAGLEH